jgi:hypothetical protein
VGGSNFGYGHPHYPAMVALRAVGVVAVVADSFSPGFWRGETYNGMPLVTVPGVSKAARRFDEIEVDWKAARVRFPARGIELTGEPPSERTVAVLEAGGKYQLLLEQHRRRAAADAAARPSTRRGGQSDDTAVLPARRSRRSRGPSCGLQLRRRNGRSAAATRARRSTGSNWRPRGDPWATSGRWRISGGSRS